MDSFNLLANTPWLLYTTVILLGLLIGSFLNVVVYRLPIMLQREWQANAEYVLNELSSASSASLAVSCIDTAASINDAAASTTMFIPSTEIVEAQSTTTNILQDEKNQPTTEVFNLLWPGSRCPHCQNDILAWQNIPVFSYLFLKGRCYYCHTSISARYPLVEFITAILSFVIVFKLGWSWLSLSALVMTWALWTLTLIDYDHQLLPDSITLPLLWLGLLLNSQQLIVPLSDAVWGAAAGYLSLWSVYWIFKLLTGKEGMGYGDFKLLAALGAWMGWQALPTIILLSSFVGALVGISLIVFKNHHKSQPIPFGPYLASAGWLYLLWGQQLNIHNWLFPS